MMYKYFKVRHDPHLIFAALALCCALGCPTPRAVSSPVDKWQKRSHLRMGEWCPRLCCDA